ncbi:MAG: DinB family protein [Planctomycetaceae bacterium]|nr:DinB family protein [Planctomycetaceae bacterium]
MNTKDAIRSTMHVSDTTIKKYLSDLSDADLLTRPGAGCNHLAWQLGHLITSEVMLLKRLSPEGGATLPDGFAEAHSRKSTDNDEPSAFLTKDQYLALYDTVRTATRNVLDRYPEPDFDLPGPEHFREMLPTQGDIFTLIALHPMMHAGQFAVVRRQLGKPVLI